MPAPLLRRSLWALAVAAGLVVLATLALPYAASTRLVRDRIALEMSEWSGLDVAIGAAPEISVWPDLQAILTDVTLSLPGGQGAGDHGRAGRDRAVGAGGASAAMSTSRTPASSGRPSGSSRRRRSRLCPARAAAGSPRPSKRRARSWPKTVPRPTPDGLPADEFGIVEFSDGKDRRGLRRDRDGDRHRALPERSAGRS